MSMSRRRFLTIAGGTTLSAVAAPALLRPSARIARAQAIPGAPTFRGAAGKSIQGPVSLNAGMAVLRAQHNGSGNFSVWLFAPNPGLTPQQANDTAGFADSWLVYDEIATYKGGSVAMAALTTDYYLAVTSSGAFQISVEQPVPGNVSTVQQTTFSGRGKDVTPYFTLPDGLTNLSVQTTGQFFRAYLYHLDDLGGGAVVGGVQGYDGRFFDLSSANPGTSFPVALPDAGPYLLSTDNIGPTDTWTLTFS